MGSSRKPGEQDAIAMTRHHRNAAAMGAGVPGILVDSGSLPDRTHWISLMNPND
ncbi:hypothetical protein [Spirulina subsalsa]|uniref:hypothetical protein n=1 Tax=Spirulina subsalsa TaxID=54311 RepID=UPI00232FCC31|nr:hypothetical protein [Spirulina subsalsa]